MHTNKKFNFSAGPSMLPLEVLRQIKEESFDWYQDGISIMEISHRNEDFIKLVEILQEDLRDILSIPKCYKILLCHGGARAQFAAVPMNLIESFTNNNVDYINSGYWSHHAAEEAKKFCSVNNIDVVIKNNNLISIIPMEQWLLTDNSIYMHYCPNETIDGIAINELPNFDPNVLVIADCSSTLLSYPLDINKFSIIYAAAQKNIGLPGLTLVIIREDLLYRSSIINIPSILNYQTIFHHNSMFNTPPVFSWYVAGLVIKWLKAQGGLIEINKRNRIKANLLYNFIDNNDFYHNNISFINRSLMNVTFKLIRNDLNKLFLEKSLSEGLYFLKGHKAAGNMRASIYNAMPLEGVEALVEFMKWFANYYG